MHACFVKYKIIKYTAVYIVKFCTLIIILSGWILHQDDASDLERQTLLEWARSRLQQVIREK